jgi:hypothetical protein
MRATRLRFRNRFSRLVASRATGGAAVFQPTGVQTGRLDKVSRRPFLFRFMGGPPIRKSMDIANFSMKNVEDGLRAALFVISQKGRVFNQDF